MYLKLGVPVVFALVLTAITPDCYARDLEKWEWYVRLIVATEAGNLKDQGNVLGQLHDARVEADQYDLRELTATFSPYLSIVFFHPEWNEQVEIYSSDYHPVTKNKRDEWVFEVRSDDPWRDLTLTWESTNTGLEGMLLVDPVTGEQMPALHGDEPQSYSFNMEGEHVRVFQWIKTKPGNNRQARWSDAISLRSSDWRPLNVQSSGAAWVADWFPPDP